MTGRIGVLIDDQGVVWADDAPELMRQLGRREAGFDLAAYAVRNLGWIHLRAHGVNLRASLREGMFNHEALIGALYQIVEWAPQRIMASVFLGEDWSYKIFSKIGEFTGYLEAMAVGEPTVPGRLFAFEHDVTVLRSPEYTAVRPMLSYWRRSRGEMGEGFSEIVCGKFFQQRATLVRKASPTRLVCEHVGIGIKALRPCEALRMLGRDMGDAPDSEYSQWVAESFAEAAAGERPRIASIRARINTSDGGALNGSYCRVLLPWRRGTDTMVLGMSILRDRSVVA